jgi:hypothetical protein
MRRRFFLGASLSLAASGARGLVVVGGQANRTPVRFSLSGTMEQGSLALGSAPPGSLAALDGRPLRVTGDGRFAFGFAPDQTTASLVTVRYPGGGGDSRSYTPTLRQYEIQRVSGLPQNTVTPPPEVKERIAREAEAIFLARARRWGGPHQRRSLSQWRLHPDRSWPGCLHVVSASKRAAGEGGRCGQARPAHRPDRGHRPRHRTASALGDELVSGPARSVALDTQAEAGAATSIICRVRTRVGAWHHPSINSSWHPSGPE